MQKQSLVKCGITVPHEEQQVRYEKQSSLNSVIIIRLLAIFFCLAFWYGVYKLVNYVFLGD